jgi:twinkle protein
MRKLRASHPSPHRPPPVCSIP